MWPQVYVVAYYPVRSAIFSLSGFRFSGNPLKTKFNLSAISRGNPILFWPFDATFSNQVADDSIILQCANPIRSSVLLDPLVAHTGANPDAVSNLALASVPRCYLEIIPLNDLAVLALGATSHRITNRSFASSLFTN